MDIISNRLPAGSPVRVAGEVHVQGRPVALGEEGPIGEYVRQNDLFLPCMTTTEVLRFMAMLKLPRSSFPRKVVEERIAQVTMRALRLVWVGMEHSAVVLVVMETMMCCARVLMPFVQGRESL